MEQEQVSCQLALTVSGSPSTDQCQHPLAVALTSEGHSHSQDRCDVPRSTPTLESFLHDHSSFMSLHKPDREIVEENKDEVMDSLFPWVANDCNRREPAWEKGLTPGGPHSCNIISVHISASEITLYQHTPSQVVCLWVHFTSSLWKEYENKIMTLPEEDSPVILTVLSAF